MPRQELTGQILISKDNITKSIMTIDKKALSIIHESKKIIILPTLLPPPTFKATLLDTHNNQGTKKIEYLLGNMSLQKDSNIKLELLGLSGNIDGLQKFVSSDNFYNLMYRIFKFKFSTLSGVVKPTVEPESAVILPHFAYDLSPNPQPVLDEAALFVPFVNPQKNISVSSYRIA